MWEGTFTFTECSILTMNNYKRIETSKTTDKVVNLFLPQIYGLP